MHVVRMVNNQRPKQILYSELFYGERKAEGQNLGHKDKLSQNAQMQPYPLTLESIAHKTAVTRKSMTKQATKAKTRRVMIYIYKENGDLTCTQCDRILSNKIGYTSHQNAHNRAQAFGQ